MLNERLFCFSASRFSLQTHSHRLCAELWQMKHTTRYFTSVQRKITRLNLGLSIQSWSIDENGEPFNLSSFKYLQHELIKKRVFKYFLFCHLNSTTDWNIYSLTFYSCFLPYFTIGKFFSAISLNKLFSELS